MPPLLYLQILFDDACVADFAASLSGDAVTTSYAVPRAMRADDEARYTIFEWRFQGFRLLPCYYFDRPRHDIKVHNIRQNSPPRLSWSASSSLGLGGNMGEDIRYILY